VARLEIAHEGGGVRREAGGVEAIDGADRGRGGSAEGVDGDALCRAERSEAPPADGAIIAWAEGVLRCAQDDTRRNNSDTLLPPNPNGFDSAARIGIGRGVWAM